MKKVLAILSQTIKGGIFFLIPIVLTILFFEKAIQLLNPFSELLSEKISGDVGVFDNPYFLTILILILFCLFAGYIANLGFGKKIILWIENNILTLFPGYQLMKNTLQNTAGLESDTNFPVVLAPIDGWMLGFQVDELASGEVVVFIPAAPYARDGNVVIFEKDKIRSTNISQKDVQKIMRQLGVNSKSILDTIKIEPS